MATTSSAVLVTPSHSARDGFLRSTLKQVKSIFSRTTMPEPMSEIDVQKYLYPVRPVGLDCELVTRKKES